MFDLFEIEHFGKHIKGDIMILNERQSNILDYLNEHSQASVHKLAAHFFVSEMTIRRDLKKMEQAGYLHRYNGGATKHAQNETLPFDARKLLHADQKAAIANAVRPFLRDSLSVFIDSSATCTYVIPLLSEYRDIRIVTNSLNACVIAAEYHIPCTIAGGMVYEKDLCAVGAETVEFLRAINVNIAFFSSYAISSEGLITDNDAEQTAIRRCVLKNCQQSIVLLNESKCNKTCLYTFCHSNDVTRVIFI